jgi:DNA-binding XRE family transcriptional regulator
MSISVEKLKALRLYNGWSQERLAEISGLSPRTIQRIEGGLPASLETQLSLASALGVALPQIVEEEEIVIGKGGVNIAGISGLVICFAMMYWQFYLPGTPFFDGVSVLLVVGLVFGMAAIAMGLKQTLSAFSAMQWVFVLPKQQAGLQGYLPKLNRIVFYCYSAGALSSLVGVIAVLMTPTAVNLNDPLAPLNPMLMGFGISLLTLLYGAMFAELIIRPLKHQLERMLIEHQNYQSSK